MSLQTRITRLKKPKREFICALCRSPRQMRYQRYLSRFQYFQIVTLIFILSLCFYPWTGFRGVFVALMVWPLYETAHKILYRRELQCPHCGFDPTWYRRDVSIAKKKVKLFWDKITPSNDQVEASKSRVEEKRPDVMQ